MHGRTISVDRTLGQENDYTHADNTRDGHPDKETIINAYKIIAQEANDIMNVRHDVAELQDEHKTRKRC